MKKAIAIIGAVGTICILAGWGTQGSNVAGDKKQTIKFYGTLETWASPRKPMEVENISIENIFRQIPMYVKPSGSAIATSSPKTDTKQTNNLVLQKDPKTSLIQAEIDLAEVGEVKVPFPDQFWIYQKDDRARKNEFVQVTIISNDAKKTKTDYLVEKRKKIFCDRISAAGPGEQKVPLTAIKSLKIKGYKDRELEKSKKRKQEEQEKIKRLAKKASS